ncbi:hypothetical protein CABS01_05017 [Colletotrichum abscissum]|uniref:uncharacterized protein n=1 Tax=Colletotrichum abscissum TaxID=1671311 RepID=UPI0027D4B8D8|nr:uncharacterized protein CABS01_05017 [Colletotrichum abscissum]KAK1523396.1 hypothetical protein CABS01_05017 [Colletotrichum abscissum]
MIGQTDLCTPATITVELTALAALQQVTQEPALAQPPRVTFHGIHETLPFLELLCGTAEAAKLSPSMRLRMIRDSSIICESFTNPLIGGMYAQAHSLSV